MFFAYANMHTCTSYRRNSRSRSRGWGRGSCHVDLFWRCTSCSFFAPTNDLPCLHHQRSPKPVLSAYYFVCSTLCIHCTPHVSPAVPHPILPSIPTLFLPQLAGELIITYHSWRTYPKSKHLTLLIRLMPVGCTGFSPGYMQRAPCFLLPDYPELLLDTVCSVFSKLKRKSLPQKAE